MLGPVAGCVDAPQRHVAHGDLVAVLERVVGIGDSGAPVDADRDAVVEGEPAVAGDVIGVRVRLQHADDANLAVRRLREQRLDRVGRIHHHRLARALAADQVGGAAEIVVDELMEEHGDDGTTAGRYRS